jgi:hypothetical protein
MENTTIIQGRKTTYEDIKLIQDLIAANPQWHRTRLSKELCTLWGWHNANGQMKDMACRTFLLNWGIHITQVTPISRGRIWKRQRHPWC